MDGKLTDKQKRFALEYIQDCNGMQAAIRAGYSKKSAKKSAEMNMKNPLVRKAIQDKLAEIDSSRTASAKEVMEFLSSVMRGETKESVLCMDVDGAQKPIYIPSNTNSRLKAADLLGKAFGIYTEKVEQSVDMELKIEIDYGEDSEHED